MTKVILFDVDNTLLYTGGAGSYAFNLTFKEMFGIPDGFARVEFSGRTDRYILEKGLAAHSIEGGAERHLGAFTRRYYQLLPHALTLRDGYVMPGVPELLQALRQRGARLALATGNFSDAAWIKLDYYGLKPFFEGGGFGEKSVNRTAVVEDAIHNAADGTAVHDILVIGDTPHDISAALDNGVVAIGVATGNFTAKDLESSGAHITFPDFSDWQHAAATLFGHR